MFLVSEILFIQYSGVLSHGQITLIGFVFLEIFGTKQKLFHDKKYWIEDWPHLFEFTMFLPSEDLEFGNK